MWGRAPARACGGGSAPPPPSRGGGGKKGGEDAATLPLLARTQRIETEIGRREPSVRELFRTATMLASKRPETFVYRPQSQASGAGPSGARGGVPAGLGGILIRRRSEDPSLAGSRPTSPAAGRPGTPDDWA